MMRNCYSKLIPRRTLKDRIDKGCDGATLCEKNKAAKYRHKKQDRQEPELFPNLHEQPQLSQE